MKKILFLLCLFPAFIIASPIIGELQSVELGPKDSYATIAQKFDTGYYELYEANPGINPDTVQPGTVLIIPTRYIVPDKLEPNSIVVNLAELRLYYEAAHSHKVFTFPIGIGKEGWMTPPGSYKIMQKIKHPYWLVPKSIRKYRAAHGQKVGKVVAAGKNNPLGDYALRLSNPSYLIHGTDDPVGIGRRSSAGCIRMYPKDIKRLFNMVRVGTKVFIVDDPYKVTRFAGKIYLEAHQPLYEQRLATYGSLLPAINAVQAIVNKVPKENVMRIAKQHLGIPLPLA